MLGVLGLIIPDVLGAPLYMLPELGTERLLPFTIIVVTAFGGLEVYRVQSILQGRDLNSRVYPGGKRFDPLGLAKGQASGQQESASPGKIGFPACVGVRTPVFFCMPSTWTCQYRDLTGGMCLTVLCILTISGAWSSDSCSEFQYVEPAARCSA